MKSDLSRVMPRSSALKMNAVSVKERKKPRKTDASYTENLSVSISSPRAARNREGEKKR
jgi:hypothetical protein